MHLLQTNTLSKLENVQNVVMVVLRSLKTIITAFVTPMEHIFPCFSFQGDIYVVFFFIHYPVFG